MRSLFETKVIKSPRVKDEVCILTVPDPESVLALAQVAAAGDEETAERQLSSESLIVDEELEEETVQDPGEEPEEALLDPQEAAAEMLVKAQEEAEQIITAAHQEADRALTVVQQECEKLKIAGEEEFAAQKEAGYETGYQEGLTAGQQAAQEEWETRLAKAEEKLTQAKKESADLLKQAEEERRARILSSEQEILKLACEIAEKIISTELKQAPNQWLVMIGAAVKKVAGATELTIRVAQEDEAFMIQHLKEIRSRLSESPPIRLVSDSTLKPGDLLLQSNLGQVDARISQQIARIFQALKEEGSEG